MGKGNIRLHPKYGLNPTMPVCWLCGQEIGEIVLLGAAYKGEAPRRMVLDKTPCNQCKTYMTQGVIFLGVIGEPTGDLEGNENRSGHYLVIRDEAVRRIIADSSILERVLEKRLVFVPAGLCEQLLAQGD